MEKVSIAGNDDQYFIKVVDTKSNRPNMCTLYNLNGLEFNVHKSEAQNILSIQDERKSLNLTWAIRKDDIRRFSNNILDKLEKDLGMSYNFEEDMRKLQSKYRLFNAAIKKLNQFEKIVNKAINNYCSDEKSFIVMDADYILSKAKEKDVHIENGLVVGMIASSDFEIEGDSFCVNTVKGKSYLVLNI